MSSTEASTAAPTQEPVNGAAAPAAQPAGAAAAGGAAGADSGSASGNDAGAAAASSDAGAAAQAQAQAQAAAQQAANQSNTSLYVGELDPIVTEAALYEIFNMVGPVQSIRVCRDAVTRRSLGYAYINYLNASDAERALEQLNYSLIRNRPCRIMWSQRDPQLRRTGQGNIFIKNLDDQIDNKALHDTFTAFGNILSCKVATNETGQSLGYGFVHYETKEAADAAIKHVNGMLLNDKKVFVGHHIPRKERQAKIEEARSRFTNVYIKNLDTSVTQEELEEMFTKYGKITSAVLSVDEEGKSRGFGFINFENHDQAQDAVNELHDSEHRGQKLFVARAQKKTEREDELRRSYEAAKNEKLSKFQGVNLYLKNIPEEFDDERLREEFAPFGTITSCKIMRSPTGVSRGFGFVCYAAPEEANKAVQEMNGKMMDNKPLYVTLAQRKDVRRQQLEAQLMQRNQIRMQQQAAAAGMGAFPGAPPMFYPPPPPPGAAGFPGQPGGMPGVPRPRYAPAGMMAQGMPMGGPYGQPQFPGQMLPQQQQQQQQQQQGGGFRGGAGGPGGAAGGPGGAGGRGGAGGAGAGGAPRGGPMSGAGGASPAAGVRGPAGVNGGRPGGLPGQPPLGAGQAGGVRGGPMAGGPGGRGGPLPGGGARGPGGVAGQAGPGQGQQQQAPQPPMLNAAALANASPEDQKQMLGEAIYPKIAESRPEQAGKLTGMILELPVSELLHLLEDPEALDAKVLEALDVLRQFEAGQA
ncbi:Protein phosphatase PP2A regulatory subunit B [Tilletia horrida]|nr:Protein phosphatase PP2A regulatory subunit B [Tilletia horrida]